MEAELRELRMTFKDTHPTILSLKQQIANRKAALLYYLAKASDDLEKASVAGPWRKRFDEVYRLAPGQVLKRVAPPFIPERKQYYREEHAHQYEAIKRPPNRFIFHWLRGKRVNWGLGFTDDHSVRAVLRHALGMHSHRFSAPDEVMNLPLPGDWIVDKAASDEQLLTALATIIGDEPGRPVRFVRRAEPREAVIARGRFEQRPLPHADARDIHLLTGDPVGQRYRGGSSGSVDKLLKFVEGQCLHLPVVNLAEYPADVAVSWLYYLSGQPRKQPDGPEREAAIKALLETLSKQTGLRFERETRDIEVWRLETTQPERR